ncbi:MAG: type I 3-dehydroquinate dehydratase [Candidatus Bathyarchaeia archaeon]
MKIRICTPITAKKTSEIPTLIKRAEQMGADLAEIRMDYLESFDGIEKAVENTKIPLIATNRQYEQGGKRRQNENERVKMLLEAADMGFSLVDIEITTPNIEAIMKNLKKTNAKTILSFHNFSETPSLEELRKIVASQIGMGAGICKLVTMAKSLNDNLTFLSLAAETSRKKPIICFAMGKLGILSRIFSPMFGGYLTYASLESGMETAPGQISIERLKEIYRLLGVENL